MQAVAGYHQAFLNALVDSASSVAVTRLDKADSCYISYLEQQIALVPADLFRLALGPRDNATIPIHSSKVFELMRDIAGCIRRLHQFAINDALGQADIMDRCLGSQPSALQLQAFARIVFIVCGWITMLYRPDLDGSLGVYLAADREGTKSYLSTSQPPERAKRPLVELIRGFGDILPTALDSSNASAGARRPVHGASSAVTTAIVLVSHLNADTLCSIGGIEIVWVHCISSHLLFDRLERKLFLFCLPSFCKVNMVGQTPFERRAFSDIPA